MVRPVGQGGSVGVYGGGKHYFLSKGGNITYILEQTINAKARQQFISISASPSSCRYSSILILILFHTRSLQLHIIQRHA